MIDEATQVRRILPSGAYMLARCSCLSANTSSRFPRCGRMGVTDKVTPDLAELARLLRRLGGESSVQG